MGEFNREDMKEILWRGLEELDLAMLSIRSRSGYEFINPAFMRHLGLSEEEIYDPSFEILDWIHPEERGEFAERAQQQISGTFGQSDIVVERVVQEDGTVMHVLVAGVLVDFHGDPAMVSASVDITERVEAYEQLEQTLRGTISAMARVVEKRDPYTAGHQRRAAELACAIAERMEAPEQTVAGVRMAGVIHDLGKLSVPTDILSNPGKLTDLEFGIIKTHPQIAYDILKDIDFTWPLADIVFQHHERFDGSGYPQGLTGDDILIEARILGVADVVEAMASHRPYRPALGIETALDEISSHKATRYASEPAEVCLEVFADGTFSFETLSK